MAAKNLEINDLFKLRGKLWEVIGFNKTSILVRSENEELSSIPLESDLAITIM